MSDDETTTGGTTAGTGRDDDRPGLGHALATGASEHPRPSLRALWTDPLGRWSTRAVQLLALVAIVSIVVFGLVQLKLVVIPVLLALILAAAAAPLVGWLRRHGLSPILAAWVTLLGGILVFGGIITGIVFAVRDQWDELYDSALDGFEQLRLFIVDGPFPIDQSVIDDAFDWVVDFLTSAQFGSGAIAGVSAAAQVVTGLFLGVVILFFFLKDGDVIWSFFLRPFRGRALERGRRVGRTGVTVLGGYVRGTAIIAAVDAIGIGVGLAILQVPLWLPLSVIVFIGAFVPLVGATVAGTLAALIALVANGPVAALIVIAIVIGVNQLEGNFLQPVVMAQSLKLHPLVILVALTAGTILGGIVGAILSVPIAAVSWAILKAWNEPAPPGDPGPDGESGPAPDGADAEAA
ncbi:AI-2E family transporter [Agromyces sp. SYSU T00194]|uniref:AI-2E family transporter n=1 Tax=Agromyces chitinivorans TaxID=3158560 RepID=UPI003390D953